MAKITRKGRPRLTDEDIRQEAYRKLEVGMDQNDFDISQDDVRDVENGFWVKVFVWVYKEDALEHKARRRSETNGTRS